jgi:hypothetical protein
MSLTERLTWASDDIIVQRSGATGGGQAKDAAAQVAEHLPGRHDQKSHGNWATKRGMPSLKSGRQRSPAAAARTAVVPERSAPQHGRHSFTQIRSRQT